MGPLELFKVYAGSVAFLGLKAEQAGALSHLTYLKRRTSSKYSRLMPKI